MRRFLKIGIGGSCLLLGLIFIFSFRADFLQRPLSPVLFSAENELLAARIAADEQWRFPFGGIIPRKYLLCLLLSEDQYFFWHHGVDAWALLRAIYLNLKAGKVVSGGSTLTMQLVRLWRQQPRTFLEKLKEIFYAWRLELFLSKRKILELYTANAPFGGNVVGLDTASWLYFQRAPQRLSWAESALLAVLPNNPALLHLTKNRQKLKQKRDRLLKKLLKKKLISKTEYHLALAEPLPERQFPPATLAPHLLTTILGERKNQQPLFRTFIQRDLQEAVFRIVEAYGANLRTIGINNASCIVIDNQQARIVAYIGNSGLEEAQQIGQFVDVATSPRSSGSILKPLLYAAMIDRGELTPWMLVPDVPSHYQGLIVENFDRSFRGAIPAYRALAYSLNVSFVHLLRNFGLNRFYDQLQSWKFTTISRSVENYGLSLILGGAEVKLREVASTYSKLAQLASGRKKIVTPRLLITDEQKSGELPALSPGAAYLTMSALSLVNRPGEDGFWRNFSSSRRIAFKTGTSYGLRDAWAVGCTPRYTVAVWVGNSDGQGNPELTGVGKAAPLMFAVFNYLGGDEWFHRPEEKMKAVRLCRLSGYLATEHCPAEWHFLPVESNFTRLCSYHQLVHLDQTERWQVDSRCYPVALIKTKSWFVLPPQMEFYYQRANASYQPLPPWLKDCCRVQLEMEEQSPFGLIYPPPEAKIFLPVDIDGRLSSIVLRAVHRQPEKTIFWYLDDQYLNKTTLIHELQLQPESGRHLLTLVDEDGNRLQRYFTVKRKER